VYKKGIGHFKFFVGISSLAQIATRNDRVCVLNISGGESSEVTPVSHEYSGGNVVFGTSPGRGGSRMETAIGNIPVYNSVLNGLSDGHTFNCGVVYLPPAAARHGVGELIRVNPDLEKVFIVTEKIPAHDAREIRAMGQSNGIDIFGANSLGVADSWNHVRIGGALGGNTPEEALRKGSIAILSNSGNFTTTIATYLRMSGWGTTTLISSGKDVYIHYAAPEFAFALANDMRSKAAVLYVEPGGYYEYDADFTKPIVACVVGRWKSTLTRAVGHAGAMAGGGDDAESKERWFMEKFGVDDLFTPENPVHSARGAVVTNIAHIPAALTAVMSENATRPDFAPEGSLDLKPWFGRARGITLPPELDIPNVVAIPPYDKQIEALDAQVGALPPRQSMKDASGASLMDPATQVSSLRGLSILQAAQQPLEANIVLGLLGRRADERDCALVNVAVGAHVNLYGTTALDAVAAAREAGNTPNTVIAAAVALAGPVRSLAARKAVAGMLDAFAGSGAGADGADGDLSGFPVPAELVSLVVGAEPDPLAEALLTGLATRSVTSVFLRWLGSLGGHPTAAGVHAAIALTLAWDGLTEKRVSRVTVEELPWWMELFGTIVGAAAPVSAHQAGAFCGVPTGDILGSSSLTELAAASLLGHVPSRETVDAFAMLTGLLLTNGPGAITAQGAKGAVSADGPQTPGRVQLNKAMLGFLTHAGYSHGGNGYEGIAFLLARFAGVDLVDPGDPGHGLPLTAMTHEYAVQYARERAHRKETGAATSAIPCINHPVFKGKAVNIDPREEFVRTVMVQRGEYNVFHEYYRELVQALFDEGATRNVFCVNVDALIATLLLKILWPQYRTGELTDADLENAAFTAFLLGRMIGCAAEIDDHQNRGRNMDVRTPQRALTFVS
jgi:succinyl-CoA synthetase alpha subunit